MTKPISCEAFTPAHPGRRENFAPLPGIRGSDRTMGSMPGARVCVNREFPKNTVNIDKFPEMFMGQTNGILFYELANCRNILK